MSPNYVCSECGLKFSASSATGVCPKCLLKAGLDSANATDADVNAPTIESPDPRHVIEQTADSAVQRVQTIVKPGTKIRYFGDYELLEEIARGGMGIVYKAKQVSLNRVVALKMILAGQMAGEDDIKRFHIEAEAAAQLDHPGIVPIHEVGEYDGQHYFAMGFVDGISLADKIKDGPLPPREAAEYVKDLAQAVDYAHQNGVIHRDLKPGNVLIDSKGKAKVTDFGLAKKVDGGSDLTATGQVLGTPSYMPPEQAAGRSDQIGVTADVYSLGAILYALIIGRPPFQSDSAVDTMFHVLEKDPVPPRQLNAKVPKDLETICLKCLQKESFQRYDSALALANDLTRFLKGEPIVARPISAASRVWRWCKRNPVIASLSVSVIAAILIGFVATLWQWQRAESNFVELQTSQEQLLEQRKRIRRHLYNSDMNVVQRAWELNDATRMREVLKRHKVDSEADEPIELKSHAAGRDQDLRGFAWHYWWRRCHDESQILPHPAGLRAVAWSPDGQWIATICRDNKLRIWRMNEGSVVRTLDGTFSNTSGWGSNVFFTSDSQAIVAPGTDGTVFVLSVDDGSVIRSWKVDKQVGMMALSPDESTLATAHYGDVKIWDFQSGELRREFKSKHTLLVLGLTFSPDGKFLAFGGDCDDARPPTYKLELYNVETDVLDVLDHRPSSYIQDVKFSPDGKILVSANADGDFTVWHGTDYNSVKHLSSSMSRTERVVFLPDNSTMIIAGRGVDVWQGDLSQPERGWMKLRLVRELVGHPVAFQSYINAIAFSPDAKRIATAGLDGTVRIWPLNQLPTDVLIPKTSPLQSIPLGSERGAFIVDGDDGKLIWSSDSSPLKTPLVADDHDLVALSETGIALYSKREGDIEEQRFTYQCTNLRTSHPVSTIQFHDWASHSVFSVDGKSIAIANENGVFVWDVATGSIQKKYETKEDESVNAIRWSPNGKTIAMSIENAIILWDTQSGAVIRLPGHRDLVRALAFNHNGSLLASGGYDDSVRIWNAKTTEQLHILIGHSDDVAVVSFAPNGDTLASTDSKGYVWLWDVVTGELQSRLKTYDLGTRKLAWSGDGRTLAAVGWRDSSVRLWNAFD